MNLDKSKIDMLRARLCMSIKDLSLKAGVSTATIRKGYSGKIEPLSVGKLAKALGVDVKEIVAGDEDA